MFVTEAPSSKAFILDKQPIQQHCL